jgi:hypothetical protein
MSNKSQFSYDSKKRKKNNDSIPCRIEFIKKLLEGKNIKPLVDFDNTSTECFVGKDGENESSGSFDTREVLKKKFFKDFKKVIFQIGDTDSEQLDYIKSGTSGHTFRGQVINEEGNKIEYGVKVVAYPKKDEYGDIHDIRRPENAELKMIKVLSYFVVKRQTPHIVLPIGIFDTSISAFVTPEFLEVVEDRGEKNDKYRDFLEKYKKKTYYNTVSILLSEWANRGDFLEFMKKNILKPIFELKHYKSFFFQLLSVLAVIQAKYSSFRHNDLKANNILIHKITKPDITFGYRIGGKKYKVTNVGYQLKLWDFDFACIPGIVENTKVELKWTKKINVTPKQNRYYDVHYFFNTLIKNGFCPEIMTSSKVPQEVKDFINRVLPTKYQNDPRAQGLKNYIEKILPEEYKRKDIGSLYINGYKIPSNVKTFIEENLPEKYKDVPIGIVHEKGRLLVDDEYLTPQQILENDPFFEEYRVKDSDGVTINETSDKKKTEQEILTGQKTTELEANVTQNKKKTQRENIKFNKNKTFDDHTSDFKTPLEMENFSKKISKALKNANEIKCNKRTAKTLKESEHVQQRTNSQTPDISMFLVGKNKHYDPQVSKRKKNGITRTISDDFL